MAGAAPGLQIQCGALHGVPGGFDSHAPPPIKSMSCRTGLFASQIQRGHFLQVVTKL